MLANSYPLPLIIDYLGEDRDITAAEEEGIMHALQLRARVRRIRLRMSFTKLQKFLVVINQPFPILEYLYIRPPAKHNSGLILPNTFQAPHLRHLVLHSFAFPIKSPLLTTTVGLVTLSLVEVHGSTYFHPNDLLQQLSLLPQLEILEIDFHFPVPSRDVARQLSQKPIVTHLPLPNVRQLTLGGVMPYLEALLPRITAPLLEKLEIWLFLQLNFSVPRLRDFISATENLRFGSATFEFNKNYVRVNVYPHQGAAMYNFSLTIHCKYLDWQVVSAAQIFSALTTVFSAVEYLSLSVFRYPLPPETNNEVHRTQWRELLMLFSNVKTLRVDAGLADELSRALQVDDGEAPMELLPELEVLLCHFRDHTSQAFKPFIDARQNAGHPVLLLNWPYPRGFP
jgi:hypothetical protein